MNKIFAILLIISIIFTTYQTNKIISLYELIAYQRMEIRILKRAIYSNNPTNCIYYGTNRRVLW